MSSTVRTHYTKSTQSITVCFKPDYNTNFYTSTVGPPCPDPPIATACKGGKYIILFFSSFVISKKIPSYPNKGIIVFLSLT